MARNEADREDLMAEAVSLVRRIECQIPTREALIVIGFNQQEWLFVYLGSDPMYRFDEQGRLRRAFVDGKLYRTTGQTLAAMRRQRSPITEDFPRNAESLLLRHELSDAELDQFRKRMKGELEELIDGLRQGKTTRQHPIDATGLNEQIQHGLKQVLESKKFLAPAIVHR